MPKPATAEVVTCGPLMVSGRRNKEEVLPVAEVLRIMQSSDLWVVGRRYGEAHVATLAMPKYMAASQTADLGELQKVLQCDLLPQKLRHDAAVSFLGNVCTILDMHSADFGVAAAVMMNLGFLSGFRPLAAICRDLKLYDRVASVLERFHASEPPEDVSNDMNCVVFPGVVFMNNCCAVVSGEELVRHCGVMVKVARRIANDFLHDIMSTLTTVLFWGFLAGDAHERRDVQSLAHMRDLAPTIAAMWERYKMDPAFASPGTEYVVKFFVALVTSGMLPAACVPGPLRALSRV